MFYISSWAVFTSSIEIELGGALNNGKIRVTDTVWYGPSGDVSVAATAADLSEEYGEFVDKGTVAEFVSD